MYTKLNARFNPCRGLHDDYIHTLLLFLSITGSSLFPFIRPGSSFQLHLNGPAM